MLGHIGRPKTARRGTRRVTAANPAPGIGVLVLAFCACAGTPPGGGEAVFYPPPPAAPRLQYLTQYSRSEDVAEKRGSFSRLVLGDEDVQDEVVKPYGVAIARGSIYTCDTKRNVVIIFDLEKKRFGYLGVSGRGKLLKPINVRADDRGFVYIADAQRAEVVVFDADDSFTGVIGTGQLEKPVDLAIHGSTIYVCDAEACEIVAFDRGTGALLRRFGGKGTAEGRFARPTNVTTDRHGNVYVSDTINGRIQKLDPEGRHLQTFGSLGDGYGQFARPKGIAVDGEDRLYAVDAAFENVQIFDPEGRLLLFFAGAGNGPGQLNLPAQVIVDYDHVRYFKEYESSGFSIQYLVIVTSQYGPRKINVFGFGTAPEGR